MHLVLDHVATRAGTTSVTGERFDLEVRGGHSHFARGHLGLNAPEDQTKIKPGSALIQIKLWIKPLLACTKEDQHPSLAQTDPNPKPVESRFDFWP